MQAEEQARGMKMSTAGCADQQEEDPVAFGRGCELRDEQKEQGTRGRVCRQQQQRVDSEASQTVDEGGVHQPVDHA